MYPDDLRYTREHEWARRDAEGIRVGITHYAQDALGDIVYVDIPGPGTTVTANQPFGEVESTKSVSDLFSPITGTILERNGELEDSPELVNQDPYGRGWMVVIQPEDGSAYDQLLSPQDYQALVEAESTS